MALEGFAGHVPSWVPGKAVPGEMTCQRHSAAKLHNLLMEKLHFLQEIGAGEAILVGMGLGEAKPTTAKWACRNQEQNPFPLRGLSSALLTKLNILPPGKEISILSHSSVFTVQAKRVILERRGNNSITGTGIKCFAELFRHLKKRTQGANLQNLSSAHN